MDTLDMLLVFRLTSFNLILSSDQFCRAAYIIVYKYSWLSPWRKIILHSLLMELGHTTYYGQWTTWKVKGRSFKSQCVVFWVSFPLYLMASNVPKRNFSVNLCPGVKTTGKSIEVHPRWIWARNNFYYFKPRKFAGRLLLHHNLACSDCYSHFKKTNGPSKVQ